MHTQPPQTTAVRVLRTVFSLLGLALAQAAFAQGVVSSGITGVVKDTADKIVTGATLTTTHIPTGTTYTASTSSTGRYNFRGLIVGGPYTLAIKAAGYKDTEITSVVTQLGIDIDLNLALEPVDVVKMDKFTVEADRSALDSNATGAASVLSRDRILTQPTSQRSFADMARTNSLVTLRNVFGDRQEAMLTAVGTNNRFNSIMLDGARINDAFGLNASGLQSFFNPLSLETVEQFSVSVSPYDVRQSGFTGAAVNAVSRSGTNEFHGSVYGYYTDQKYADKDYIGTFANVKPLDERKTYGATLGGPIWKNHIFFFGNYEKFHREQVAPAAAITPAAADITAINAAIATLKTATGKALDFGSFGGTGVLVTDEKKKLYKVDWNITGDHRLSVRYNETIGTLPQFGKLANTASFTGIVATSSGGPIASGGGTAYSSNFYTQTRTEKVYAGSLNDQWTSDFKTEFKYSKTSYEQLTTTPTILPEIRIFGVSGTTAAGATLNSTGFLALGSEQFRHGNIIRVKTNSYSGNADYFWKDFTFTAGIDREKSDFFNLFRAGSYGIFDYANIAAFAADTPVAYTRAFYVNGTPAADLSDFADTGIFAQTKWEVTPRLNLTAGLRLDLIESSTRPPLNAAFVSTFGVRNDGNVDGTQVLSPRLGFNWSADKERLTQVRGGVGHFAGRAPWVFISNAYGTSGVGRFSVTQSPLLTAPNNAPPTLTNYLKSTFDPANPIGVAPTDGDPNARRTINLLQDGLKLPSVWRGNLALERKIPALSSVASIEVVLTKNDQALFSDQLNIKPLVVTGTSGPAIGLDGRQRFNGSSGGSGAFSTAFADVIRVRNIKEGESKYFTFSLDRPMKNSWSYNVSYTRGRSTEAQSAGQTVALDGWTRNAVFNQNTVEVGRSDFEVRNRLQITLARQIELAKGWKTTGSLYYEGHTGNPFSYTYNSDLNNDGVSANDLVYVPTGPTDAKVDFSGMTAQQQSDYFSFLSRSGLSNYAGTNAPRNAFTQPWINQLDLRITQKIPVYKPFELELFFDFTNFGYWIARNTFGYVRLLTNTNNAVYYRRVMGAATYNATGQVRPTYTADPADVVIDNVASRWRMQFGASLKF